MYIENFFEKENIFSENYINSDILLATKLDVTEESFPWSRTFSCHFH